MAKVGTMAVQSLGTIKIQDPTSSSTDTAPTPRLCMPLLVHKPGPVTTSPVQRKTSMLEKFERIKVQSKSSPPSIVLLSLQDSAYLPLGLPCMVASSSSAITKMPQLDNTESKLTLVLATRALPNASAAAFFLCLLCLLLFFRFSPEFRRKSSRSHTKAIVNIAWIPRPMKNTSCASNQLL